MTDRPFCVACGGTCFRLWEHFGEGDPPDVDVDDTDPLMGCPNTGNYCDGLNVGAGWQCEDHGCWRKHGHEDRALKQKGPA